ncbi:hypothetical protein D3C77_696100 [compost metagenome]
MDLLLQFVQRQFHEQSGDALPAQAVVVAPAHMGGDRQPVGQQHRVARLGQPAAQGRVGVELLLLVQRVFLVTGNVQGLDQQAAVVAEQAVALDDPVGQLPVFGQCLAEP